MSFREKLAWLLLGVILVGYGVYLAAALPIGAASGWRAPIWGIVPPLIAMGALTAILAAVGSIAVALADRHDAHAPADERDRAIGRVAAARAYTVLMLGVAAVISAMLFGAGAFVVANLLVGLFTLSEAVRYASEAIAYRRGWHG